MENHFIIQLTFYSAQDEISLYWMPDRHGFSFSVPLCIVSQDHIQAELYAAEQHALRVLKNRPFHIYPHNISPLLSRQTEAKTN